MQKFAGTIPIASQVGDSNSTWSYSSTDTTSPSIWPTNKRQSRHSGLIGVEDLSRTQWRMWQNNSDPYPPHAEVIDTHQPSSSFSPSPDPIDTPMPSTTLCMGNLEPWMDHEYASQVVRLMGWDRASSSDPNTSNSTSPSSSTTAPVTIKIPPPPHDITPQPNNPGYCLLTFSTVSHAASVLSSLSSMHSGGSHNAKDNSGTGSRSGGANGGSGQGRMLMPNSSRPFNLQWATTTQLSLANAMGSNNISGFSNARQLSVSSNASTTGVENMGLSSASLVSGTHNGQGHLHGITPHEHGQQKEHSIFVGDLAPETSNSDLVAVFRNPVLGLRNDREPKFIRPFYSCKSAKIMLDPVTGISRGYGFVRFTDEADQQRALIEMHGLYCLSRPMRVSPATAKFKPTAAIIPPVMDQNSIPLNIISPAHDDDVLLTRPGIVRSVSTPVAAGPLLSTTTAHGVTPSPVNGTLGPSASKDKAEHTLQQDQQQNLQQSVEQISPRLIAQIKQIAETPQQLSNSSTSSLSSAYASQTFGSNSLPYGAAPVFYDEAWNHQAQARAILGNLIGPNGEQLTSTDPYNTTVFVGGLSPLISEETLRTFFAPFGEIHYVKVPVGKHCGFVQFVRKADAERAIERMQGFPIGGSRIRLSWGRSQYKAAQAAAQAAQSAQAEQTARLLSALLSGQSPASLQITQDQAMHILQTLGYSTQSINTLQQGSVSSSSYQGSNIQTMRSTYDVSGVPDVAASSVNAQIERPQYRTSFSPFSSSTAQNGQSSYPLSDNALPQQQQQNSVTSSPTLQVPFTSRGYASSYGSGLPTTPAKLNDRNSPHSSAASSSGSNGLFASLGNTNGPFGVNASYYESQNGTFHANDLLRNESQSLFSRSTIPSSSSSPLSQDPLMVTPPRFQRAQQQGLSPKDDGNIGDILQDLNGTLASLDLGVEPYTQSAIGGGNVFSTAKDTYEEQRPQNPFMSLKHPAGNLNM